MADSYRGLLCIGDPHLASRTPGFRKDDYPNVILRKMEWALDFAAARRLLPILLGDLFHYPRDNANWLLTDLFHKLTAREILCVVGNHDCSENVLTPDDSLAILAASGKLKLIGEETPWSGRIEGRDVVIGGTNWGEFLPRRIAAPEGALVFWVTHHDIRFRTHEEAGRFDAREIPGIDVIINGHIHRPLEQMQTGKTTWLNPGNIARVSRGDASRARKPSVLQITIDSDGWQAAAIELPHASFDEVFHPELEVDEMEIPNSAFIRGLESLQALKTSDGAGLLHFLRSNIQQFDVQVANQIMLLAEEVCGDGR